MIFHLVEIIVPKKGESQSKTSVIQGDTMADILAKIEAHPQHIHNLKEHRRTSFKGKDGTLHRLFLREIVGPN